MNWNETLQTLILTVVPVLIGIAMRWLAKQKWAKDAEDAVFLAIEAATQRAKDKYLEEIVLAKAADSDGGVEVTAAEKSAARQKAFDIVMQSLKGPVLDYAKDTGEAVIKGLIGKALDKILPAKAEAATAEPVPVGQ